MTSELHILKECVQLDKESYDDVPILIDSEFRPVDSVNAWLSYLLCNSKRSIETVQNYGYCISGFWKFLGSANSSIGEVGWKNITNKEMRLFRATLVRRKISTGTTNYNLRVVLGFYRWCVRRHLVMLEIIEPEDKRLYSDGALDPSEILLPDEHNPRLPTPSYADIQAVLITIAAQSRPDLVERDQLILRCAAEFGLRNSEIRFLKYELIPTRLELGKLTDKLMGARITISGKGNKTRIVEPPTSLLNDIHNFIDNATDGRRGEWRDAGAFVFFGSDFKPLSRKWVGDMISSMFKIAGVEGHLHRGRAHYLQMWVDQKIAELEALGKLDDFNVSTILWLLADLAGHADLETLRYYINMNVKRRLKEIRA